MVAMAARTGPIQAAQVLGDRSQCVPSPGCESVAAAAKGLLGCRGTLTEAGQSRHQEVAVALIAEPLADSFALRLPGWPPSEQVQAVLQDAVQEVLHSRDPRANGVEKSIPIKAC